MEQVSCVISVFFRPESSFISPSSQSYGHLFEQRVALCKSQFIQRIPDHFVNGIIVFVIRLGQP
jgi:hypothetical protein